MMKKATAVLLGLVLLFVSLQAFADYGHAGNMISPAVLALIPQSRATNRFWAFPSRYTWSYAPLFFKPEERRNSEVTGPAATDPEVDTAAAHLKLPGVSVYTPSWESGNSPARITVSSWKAEVYSHPEQADGYALGTADLEAGEPLELEPDRVYQFHAVWESEYASEETGEADYYVVTEQMTEAEASSAEARVNAPFSEKDLMLLTLKIRGVDCVLGTTLPQDLAGAGLYVDQDYDGSVAITDSEDPYGYIYAETVDGTMDSPIYFINAYWGYEIPIEYCGVILSEPTIGTENDPDDDWDDDGNEDEPADENGPWDVWQVLDELADNPFYIEESEEGIASTVITLSNGQELYVSEHSSPVSLTLLGVKEASADGD